MLVDLEAAFADFAAGDRIAALALAQVAAQAAELVAGSAAELDPGFEAADPVAAAAGLGARARSRLGRAPELRRTPLETPIQTFVRLLGKIS